MTINKNTIEIQDMPVKFLVLTDEFDILRAMKVSDVLAVLWDLDQHLRSEVKYNSNEHAEQLREKFWDIMNTYNVSFDELYR